MRRSTLSLLAIAALVTVVGCGGEPDRPGVDSGTPPPDSYIPILRCSTADDPDGDYISSMDETDADADDKVRAVGDAASTTA